MATGTELRQLTDDGHRLAPRRGEAGRVHHTLQARHGRGGEQRPPSAWPSATSPAS